MLEPLHERPMLDVERALDCMDNDAGAYADVCEVFCEEALASLAALRAAALGNPRKVSRVLHEMASSMAIVGALEASNELRGYERALKSDTVSAEQAGQAAQRAAELWLQATAAVRQWLHGHRAA